jgi:DNA polymerase-1
MSKIYLIDGNAYIHRAYHAIPPLTTSKGESVNAIYGFIRMFLKLINSKNPEYLVVCFDYPAKNFRHKAYELYKAHRKEIDAELKTQMPIAREAVRAFNIAMIEKEGFEADDLIATLAKEAEKDGSEAVIITGDKDALQLVDDKISVWNEQREVLYTPEKVKEKYGLEPGQLNDMFSLMGDSSDNVPGVKGIGEKTAVKLIQKFGSLEKLLENLDSVEGRPKELIANSKEEAIQSKMLVTLHKEVPLDLSWKDCKTKPVDQKTAEEFLRKYEFNSLLKDIFGTIEAKVEQVTENTLKFKTNIVDSEDALENLVKKINKAGYVSVDLETDSVNPLKARIVGLSFACDGKDGYYIPVGHDYLGAGNQLPLDTVLKSLKEILESDKIRKYGQNIKYDYIVFKKNGIKLACLYFDTMVASYCLNPSRMTQIEELIGKGAKQSTMDKVEIEKAADYACADAVMVYLLVEKFSGMLSEKKLSKLFFEVEMHLVEILAKMEEEGIKIDSDYLKDLSKEFLGISKKLEKDIFELAGQEFNPNSPKQLSHILFEKLQLPIVRKTKTGFSTDEEVLITLSSQHELPKKLIEYREIQKLKSTYIDSLLELADKDTQRVHTSFNQAITATGRLSSSNPNLQNIPIKSDYGKMIRKGFVCEKGNILLSADYSQIDLRSLAHVSGDKALTKAFNSGEDIHSATANEVFGKVDPETRRLAKTINFGIVYGQSAFSLGQQLGISNHQAKEYIDSYFLKYSGVKEWMENIVKEARQNGYVSTLLGRIRYLPDINAKNGQVRGFAERMALNTPIQGTSADIIKAAMIEVDKKLQETGLKAVMLLQVHDELVFEIPVDEEKKALPLIKTTMENAVKLNVPIVADLKIGHNWLEMKKV